MKPRSIERFQLLWITARRTFADLKRMENRDQPIKMGGGHYEVENQTQTAAQVGTR